MNDHKSLLETLRQKFDLLPHPEGGSYLETYRSPTLVGQKSIKTAIYFLLEEDEFSSFHRIKSDEMWHFYLGGPLEIVEIDPNGKVTTTVLGSDFLQNQKLQYVVTSGHWFASRPLKGSVFSFVGCTVSPGFEFEDFELAEREKLIAKFPKHATLITSLTR